MVLNVDNVPTINHSTDFADWQSLQIRQLAHKISAFSESQVQCDQKKVAQKRFQYKNERFWSPLKIA